MVVSLCPPCLTMYMCHHARTRPIFATAKLLGYKTREDAPGQSIQARMVAASRSF
jgi:hypothetical protein